MTTREGDPGDQRGWRRQRRPEAQQRKAYRAEVTFPLEYALMGDCDVPIDAAGDGDAERSAESGPDAAAGAASESRTATATPERAADGSRAGHPSASDRAPAGDARTIGASAGAAAVQGRRADERAASTSPGGAARRRRGFAVNVSVFGMRIAIHDELREGTILEVRFALPTGFFKRLATRTSEKAPKPFEPMRLLARVVAVLPHDPEEAHAPRAYGIEFIDLSPQVEDELARFVHLWQLYRIRTSMDVE